MRVTDVKYLGEYIIEVTFINGEVRQIDLQKFLESSKNPMTRQYLDKEKFKNVRVFYGTLTWDEEMDLSGESLYNWKFFKE